MHPIDHIRRFASLTPEIEQRLNEMMRRVDYNRGAVLQGIQTLTNNAFYVEKGATRLYYTRAGREHTISFAFSDQFVVVPRGISENYPDTLAVQVLEPTTLVFVPHQAVRTELQESGAVDTNEGILFLNAALIQYNSYLEERVGVMQTFSASERYAWALRRFPRLTECASTTQIASFLGLTKETLYRIKNGRYTANQ